MGVKYVLIILRGLNPAMLATSGASVWLLALHGPCGRASYSCPSENGESTEMSRENWADEGLHSPQTFLPASRSCTIRAATGTRAASAAPSATSRWLRSPSAPGMTARSCAASAEPERTGTVARAATRWSCQVSVLTSCLLSQPDLHPRPSFFFNCWCQILFCLFCCLYGTFVPWGL